MHYTVVFICILFTITMNSQSSFYKLSFNTLDGQTVQMDQFKGKKILIVNTASRCGFTPQLEALETLHKNYASSLVIIGFPSNEFASQDPGSNSEILNFCKKNYGVSFWMSEKIMVKKGNQQHPVYQWLTQKSLNKAFGTSVWWNFQKYLITEDGQLHAVVRSWKKPNCKRITKWLQSAS